MSWRVSVKKVQLVEWRVEDLLKQAEAKAEEYLKHDVQIKKRPRASVAIR